LRKYISLFLGRIPAYTYPDHTAKYGGHALLYAAIFTAAGLIAQALQPLGFAGKTIATVVVIGAMVGTIRSILCLKQTVD
jgi:hypothetical protein